MITKSSKILLILLIIVSIFASSCSLFRKKIHLAHPSLPRTRITEFLVAVDQVKIVSSFNVKEGRYRIKINSDDLFVDVDDGTILSMNAVFSLKTKDGAENTITFLPQIEVAKISSNNPIKLWYGKIKTTFRNAEIKGEEDNLSTEVSVNLAHLIFNSLLNLIAGQNSKMENYFPPQDMVNSIAVTDFSARMRAGSKYVAGDTIMIFGERSFLNIINSDIKPDSKAKGDFKLQANLKDGSTLKFGNIVTKPQTCSINLEGNLSFDKNEIIISLASGFSSQSLKAEKGEFIYIPSESQNPKQSIVLRKIEASVNKGSFILNKERNDGSFLIDDGSLTAFFEESAAITIGSSTLHFQPDSTLALTHISLSSGGLSGEGRASLILGPKTNIVGNGWHMKASSAKSEMSFRLTDSPDGLHIKGEDSKQKVQFTDFNLIVDNSGQSFLSKEIDMIMSEWEVLSRPDHSQEIRTVFSSSESKSSSFEMKAANLIARDIKVQDLHFQFEQDSRGPNETVTIESGKTLELMDVASALPIGGGKLYLLGGFSITFPPFKFKSGESVSISSSNTSVDPRFIRFVSASREEVFVDGPAITVNLKSPLVYDLNKGEFKEIPSFDSTIGSSDVRLVNADGSEKAHFEQLSVQLHKSQEPSSKFVIEGAGIIKIPATEIGGVSITFQNLRFEDSGAGLKLTKIDGVSSLEWNSLKQYIEREAVSYLRSQLPGQLFDEISLLTVKYSNGRIVIQNVELKQPTSSSNMFGYLIGGVVRAHRKTYRVFPLPPHWDDDGEQDLASLGADGVIAAAVPVNRPLREAGMEFNILIKNIEGNVIDFGNFLISIRGPFNLRDLNYSLPQVKLPLPLKDKLWLGNVRLNSSAIRGGVDGKIEVSISASE